MDLVALMSLNRETLLPCGHPPDAIVTADEGTSYCRGCEEAGRLREEATSGRDHTACTLCDSGPSGKHLCDFRRGRTMLDLHGRALKVNDEPWLCLVCLRTVGENRILHYNIMERFGHTILHGRLGVTKMVTGYESVCCGGAGEPWPDFENTYEEE